MAIRRITKYGEPVLRKKCAPVKNIDADIRELIRDMFETMYDAPGVGLAANQIGVDLSLAVIDLQEGGKKNPLVLINPKVVEVRGQLNEEEGCLSVPGFMAKVKRHAYCKVSALNEKGYPVTIAGEGLMARALQHETDHLNGKFYVDRLSLFKRTKIRLEIGKRKRAGLW